jgi:NTE family protein
VCVVATSLEHGVPVGFVESEHGVPPSDREIRYVPTQLSGEHVRASAALPLLFPPVEVTAPAPAAGHYVDGATRLNAPISPALALSADRVVVVGYEPLTGSPAPARRAGGPRLADVAANVLDGLLLDQVGHDVRRMLAVNEFFAEHHSTGVSPSARGYREARGQRPYRRIRYAFVAPARRGAIGALADRVFRERYSGPKALRSPDFALLARLLGGGQAGARGELLSFVLFDHVFIERLIQAGRADAERWLAAHPGLWSADGAEHGFNARAPTDAVALDEFRTLRRR